jgi:hypothetical protein
LKALASSPKTLGFTLVILFKRGGDSLIAEGWIGEKPCLRTTDSVTSETITRYNVTARLSKENPSTFCRQHQGRPSLS